MSIAESPLSAYLAELGSRASTPGGGAVAALSGAQAAALISMVANLSKTFPDEVSRTKLLDQAGAAIAEFTAMADQDAAAFKALMAAYKAKGDINAASQESAQPPLTCIRLAASLTSSIQALHQYGNANLITDTAIAALLLKDTILASELNILINLRSIKDESFKQRARQSIEEAKSAIPQLEDIASTIAKTLG